MKHTMSHRGCVCLCVCRGSAKGNPVAPVGFSAAPWWPQVVSVSLSGFHPAATAH